MGDITQCPHCHCPGRWMEMRKLIAEIKQCPFCEEALSRDDLVSVQSV